VGSGLLGCERRINSWNISSEIIRIRILVSVLNAAFEEDWFAPGMHESPFARWVVGEQDGVTPGR
jgi:hypothetical protein